MTVGRLERELSPDELGEWMAFSRLAPFADEVDARDDVRVARVCQTIVNSRRTRKQGALALKDFMLDWKKPRGKGRLRKALSPKALKAKLMALLPPGRRRRR